MIIYHPRHQDVSDRVRDFDLEWSESDSMIHITKVIEYLNKHNGSHLKQDESREFVELKLFANKNPNCFTRTITDELRESLGAY